MKEKKIVIQEGNEHKAVVLNDDDRNGKMEETFFGDARRQLWESVKRIATECFEMQKRELANLKSVGQIFRANNGINQFMNAEGLSNNILLINGGRGQGKTSLLLSFRNDIISDSVDGLSKSRTYVLKALDPSFFSDGESFIRIFVSEIYKVFLDNMFIIEKQFERHLTADCLQEHRFEYQAQRLTLLLQEIIQLSRMLEKDKIETDDLELLANISDSGKLMEKIQELVAIFLEFSLGSREGILVLPIDDMDMCSGNVYSICEQIRKYLKVPNVIIVMAADVRQIQLSVIQAYIQQNELLGKYGTGLVLGEYATKMAGKYIEKLFPGICRVNLPDIRTYMGDAWVRLEYRRDLKNAQNDGLKDEGNILNEYRSQELQRQLIEIIYKATGIVLVAQKDHMHYMLPQTMRELTHFLSFCKERIGFDGGDKPLKEKIKNISALREYLLSYWCRDYLDIKEQELVSRIVDAGEDMRMAYHSIIRFLYDEKYILQEKYNELKKKESIELYDITKGLVSSYLRCRVYLQECLYYIYTLLLNERYLQSSIAYKRDSNKEDPASVIRNYVERYFHSEISEDKAPFLYAFHFDREYFSKIAGNASSKVQERFFKNVAPNEYAYDYFVFLMRKNINSVNDRETVQEQGSGRNSDIEIDNAANGTLAKPIALIYLLNFDFLRRIQDFSMRYGDLSSEQSYVSYLTGARSCFGDISEIINGQKEILEDFFKKGEAEEGGKTSLEDISLIDEKEFEVISKAFMSNEKNRIFALDNYIQAVSEVIGDIDKEKEEKSEEESDKSINLRYVKSFIDIAKIYSKINPEDFGDDNISSEICRLAAKLRFKNIKGGGDDSNIIEFFDEDYVEFKGCINNLRQSLNQYVASMKMSEKPNHNTHRYEAATVTINVYNNSDTMFNDERTEGEIS